MNLDNTKKKLSIGRKLKGLLALAMSIAPQIEAQDNGDDDEVYSLSPFVVDASGDQGYRATNTIAGSRLNSSLKEIPAPISIMTSEFMEDANITNIDEAIGFGLNTSLREDTQDGAADSLLFGANYRIRGITSTQSARNYFIVNTRGDAYNMERATFARGPNSILFGAADPAGIVNVTTKKANFNDSREIGFRFDDEGGARYTFDLNQVLLEDRLALRASGLSQRLESYQSGSYTDEDRLYLAGTWKLIDRENAKTTVKFDYEKGRIDRAFAQKSFPTNRVSEWLRLGSQAVTTGSATISAANQAAMGIQRLGGLNRVIVPVSGSVAQVDPMNWRLMYLGSNRHFDDANPTNPLVPAFKYDGIGGWGSENILPLDVNITGSESTNEWDFEVKSLYLEQQLGQNFFVELAYNKYDNELEWWQPVGDLSLSVDVNTLLPDGSDNPNFGRYYYDEQTNVQRWNDDEESYRATASYDLDLTEANSLLGSHRFALMYSARDDANYKTMFQEQITNGPELFGTVAALNNAQNRLTRRHYIDPENGLISMGDFKTPVTAGGLETAILPVGNNSTDFAETDSTMLAIQSFFFDRKLATVVGWREDSFSLFNADPDDVFRMSNGVWNQMARSGGIDFLNPVEDFSQTTNSVGLVYALSPLFSIFANQSDNFSPQAARRTVFGESLPQPVGEGQDVGIKFELFEGKVVGTLSRFEASKEKDLITFGANNGLVRRLNDLLRISGRDDEVFLDGLADTKDFDADGYEFEVTVNPNDALRLSLNASKTENVVSNVLPHLTEYLTMNRAGFEALGDAPSVDFNGTAQDSLDLFDAFYFQQVAQEGLQPQAHREWLVNMVARYTFSDDGPLKGFAIGGTYRYNGEASIGYSLNEDGVSSATSPYFGGDYSVASLNFIYNKKISLFSRDTRMNVQLTVENLFDHRVLDARSDELGRIEIQRTIKPRTIYLSTRFRF